VNRPSQSFFYPDYTVGPGVAPGHALFSQRGKRVTQKGSWAIPPIGNSLHCVLTVSPCPEGYYSIEKDYNEGLCRSQFKN